MDAYVIGLRLFHIVGGVLWAGSGLYATWFVQPTAQAAGEAGATFMRDLMGETRAPAVMGISVVSTVLSGILLYWHDFGAVIPFNNTMLGFAIGALSAIAAWVIGLTVIFPAGRRMEELGARARDGENVGAEMAATSARTDRYSQLSAWLVIAAVVLMAVARYL